MNFKSKATNKFQSSETAGKKKISTADKVKIGVMGIILTVVATQFLGFNTIGGVKSLFTADTDDASDAYSKLGAVASTIQSSPTVRNNNPTLSDANTPRLVTSQKVDEDKQVKAPTDKEQKVPDFVVAPDYRTILAQVQLIQNALNPEFENQWVGLRLKLNAERERNRIAQVRLSRSKADAETAEFQQKTKSLLEQIEATNITDNVVSDDIALSSINSEYIDVTINGKDYVYKGVNSSVGRYKVSSIDAKKGCASLISQNASVVNVCI